VLFIIFKEIRIAGEQKLGNSLTPPPRDVSKGQKEQKIERNSKKSKDKRKKWS
jgi:hypothetical protein